MKEGRGDWTRLPLGRTSEAMSDAPVAEPSAALRTFIDPGASFEGKLRLNEDLLIECEFRGEIESDARVIIGESAGVEAQIRAREVEIRGAVVGDVVATRQLTLRAGGRLHGAVETPCLEIEKHAFFNGSTTMVRPEVALRARAVEPEPSEVSIAPPKL